MRYKQRRKRILHVKWLKMFNHRIIRELRIASRVHPPSVANKQLYLPLVNVHKCNQISRNMDECDAKRGRCFQCKIHKTGFTSISFHQLTQSNNFGSTSRFFKLLSSADLTSASCTMYACSRIST